jgi:hypothetical protein
MKLTKILILARLDLGSSKQKKIKRETTITISYTMILQFSFVFHYIHIPHIIKSDIAPP